jgi:hypothetical protein
MTDKIFVTVQSYLAVNQKGHELQEYIENEYDHAVMPCYMFRSVKKDIMNKCKELDEKYPRTRSFSINADMRDVGPIAGTYPNSYIEVRKNVNPDSLNVVIIHTESVKLIYEE